MLLDSGACAVGVLESGGHAEKRGPGMVSVGERASRVSMAGLGAGVGGLFPEDFHRPFRSTGGV